MILGVYIYMMMGVPFFVCVSTKSNKQQLVIYIYPSSTSREKKTLFHFFIYDNK